MASTFHLLLSGRRAWRARSPRSGRSGRAARSISTPRGSPCATRSRGRPPTPAGARLAARIGDGWTAFDRTFERDLPVYLEALAAAGRSRADQRLIVAFEAGRSGVDALNASPWVSRPGDELARWRAAGADDVIVTARTSADVDRLVAAAALPMAPRKPEVEARG
jgi:alkanesulfonate monooxygenase SsuD/methylene tetrahydromethanopterin reductase-like flavin-dependent oxidoreductase (luciferase family)